MLATDWAVHAGRHDPASLTSALVPPGASVAVGLGAPLGLASLLQERGCRELDPLHADLRIGSPDEMVPSKPGILTGAWLDHGLVQLGAPAPSGAIGPDDVVRAVAAVGHAVLATVRCFDQFPATGIGARLQSDPHAWVSWQAVLMGPPQLAPPHPRPDDLPPRSVLVLAAEPFGQWELERRRMLLELHELVASAGASLVLSWSEARLTGSVSAHADLARRGIILHGTDGVFDLEHASATVGRPGTRALVNAYRPVVVVVLDAALADVALSVAAAEVPSARMLGAGFDVAPVEAGVPVVSIPRRVDELLRADEPVTPPSIAVILPRRRVPGLTSVVIPVHGRWDLTRACLDSLAANTDAPLEVIVVDNASPDDTAARLAQCPEVTTITSETNLGFAGGTNLGLQAANGEFVCMLNNDTEVVPGWLEALQSALAVEGAGMVGPRSNCISGLQLLPGGPDMQDLEVARRWAASQAARGRSRSWRILRLVGFAMLLRGDLLEQLGGFDQGVGLGNYEDDDLCQRVRATGRHLRVADGAVVLHHGSATFLDAAIDALATARQGARHLGERLAAASDFVVARVVADADPEHVEQVVATARLVADEVVVLCPEATLPWALRTMWVNQRAVSVVRGDAATDVRPSSASWVLHLSGRSRIDHRDWGTARAAIEALPRTAHAIEGLPGAVLEPIVDGRMGPKPGSSADLPWTDAVRSAAT